MTSKPNNNVKEDTPSNTTESWEMALSVAVALKQTREKALQEHRAVVSAAGGNPFGKGISAAQHLIEALNDALRTLNPDLKAIGRANGRALPKEVY
jgi:hypothetical protein